MESLKKSTSPLLELQMDHQLYLKEQLTSQPGVYDPFFLKNEQESMAL